MRYTLVLLCFWLFAGCSPNGTSSTPPLRLLPQRSLASNQLLQQLADAGAKVNGDARTIDGARAVSITYENKQIGPDFLAGVPKVEGLVVLELRHCQFEKGGLALLDHMQGLFYLSLYDSPVNDSLLHELTSLPRLQQVWLEGRDVTGTGLRFLKGAKDLKKLVLRGTRIGDKDMKLIGSLYTLTELDLTGSLVTDDGLRLLQDLRNLELLVLSDCQITGSGISRLGEQRKLISLKLDGAAITDPELHNLATLRQLQGLDLSRTKISDDGLSELLPLQQLRSLSLRDTAITSGGLGSLASLRELRYVFLSSSEEMTQEVAKRLLPKANVQLYPPRTGR